MSEDLLGAPGDMIGFGAASRMTPGYAHATWDAMVEGVAKLEQPLPLKQISFGLAGSKAKTGQERKVG